MFVRSFLTKANISKQCLLSSRNVFNSHRNKHSNKVDDQVPITPGESTAKLNLGQMGSKYQIFNDEDSEIILDIYEQDNKKYGALIEPDEDSQPDPLDGLNLERGLHGVYDIEDLVDVLKRENAIDIFVALVPKEIKYVEHICVVTGKSHKHMLAIAQFVRRVFKQKRDKSDFVPRLEGADSKDWMAIDLGNIALHIFSKEARALYDLDSLWSIGHEYDKEYNKKDPVAEMLEKHSLYLQDLQPAQ